MTCDASAVLSTLQAKAMETSDPALLGETLVAGLREAMPRASWVGIRWLEEEELVLGPHVGRPTAYARVPIGQGVAGRAVTEDRDQIVDDVRGAASGSGDASSARSEIVVLIRSMGRVVGTLALDSHEPHAFGAVDQCILRAVADSFGGLITSVVSEDPVEDPRGEEDAGPA